MPRSACWVFGSIAEPNCQLDGDGGEAVKLSSSEGEGATAWHHRGKGVLGRVVGANSSVVSR